MQLGPAEVLVILVVALLVFGPTRLPELARQVGRGVREFRAFQQSIRSELEGVLSEDASDQAAPPPTLPPKASEDTTASSFPIADSPTAGAPGHEPQERLNPPGSPAD